MIVLVGFMGSGKSAVGKAVAKKTGLPFADTDALIEAREGKPVAEVIETQGERYFRAVERDVVLQVLGGPAAVVSLGGGAVGDPAVAAALEWTTVVYLQTSFHEVWRRIGSDPSRPLMVSGDPRALYEARLPYYEGVATVTVDTDGRTPDDVAAEVARIVTRASGTQAEHRRVVVPLGDRSYDVLIGDGLVDRIGAHLPALPDAEKAFVVSHPDLRRYAERVASSLRDSGLEVHGLDVPEGEGSKDMAVARRLLESLAESQAHRADVVVAVGGGVVGDLAGFVASVYARGMPVVQVPTSLLAQVDAAVGGKTGVNLPGGKNLVGSFHQPRLVLCDISTLATLPAEELRSGLAEVVKYGLIAEPELLDTIAKRTDEIMAATPAILEELVARSVWIKAGIVGADETESGGRARLNYGHTFAHALEAATGFGHLRHGAAVAIGMMAAAHLAEVIGWLSAEDVALHRRTLEAVGLPTEARIAYDELEPGWLRDKKYRGGVRFVLLSKIGEAVTGVSVERSQLEAALSKLAT